MAIAKNTAKAAEKPEVKKAPAKTAAPKAPAKPSPSKADKAATAKAEKPATAKVNAVVETEVNRVSRKELADKVRGIIHSTGAAVSAKIAETLVVAYEEAVMQALAEGAEVNLPGFGKFVSIHKEAGEKRNPATGEMVMVGAHNVPRFKAGSKLKAALNGGADVGEE